MVERKTFRAFRRGDENRPHPRILASTRLNGTAHPGSLPEGAGSPQGLTEGVSSDGSSMSAIYTPAHINSETFERLRSSKYTPSVSHSLDSSLREGAGNGWFHSTGYSLMSGVTGDFHRPYGNSETVSFYHSSDDTPSVTPFGRASSLREGAGGWAVPFNRVLAKIRGYGRLSSPLRWLRRYYIVPWEIPRPEGVGGLGC